jgi:Fe-S cluster biosynthesis and repair protein YggX
MAEVLCSRCGKTAPGLSEPPFRNELGNTVLNKVCAACWQEWIRSQLMIMNEYRLNPLNDEHSAFLDEQMKIFLKLT